MAPKKKAVKKPAARKAAPAKVYAATPAKAVAAHKHHNPETCPCPCHTRHTEYCNTSFGGIPCLCPISGVITTRLFWLASILAAVVLFGFNMWWNGHLLMPAYEATQHLWRPMWQMQQEFGMWCIAYQAALAMALVGIVLVMGRTHTWLAALSSGLLASAPLALSQLCVYTLLPMPDFYLPAMWAVGAALQGMLVGVVVKAVSSCHASCCQ